MKMRLSVTGTMVPLIVFTLLSCACVKEMRPNHMMSSPRIAGETQVKALLGARDQGLVVPAVVVPKVESEPGVPLRLSLREAVLSGLEHNESFRVERLKPTISRTAEEVERAAFDPQLTAQGSHTHGQDGRTGTTQLSTSTIGTRQSNDAESTLLGLGLTQATPLGATVELNADQERVTDDELATHGKQQNWDLTVTQSLLRGRGPGVNLVRLRQSRLDTEISLYELQGAAEALVAQIEKGYWDLVLADRSLVIYQHSLTIAQAQVAEVNERIKVGALAENEAAAAEAEAALRHQQLIAAQGTVAKARLNLLRFVNPAGLADWAAQVKLTDTPEGEGMAVDQVENHVAVALSKRPDLNQARLQVRRQDLEVVRTRNGLLPKLDLFLSLGGSRFTDSFAGQEEQLTKQHAYAGGLTLELPLANRAAKARHAAAGWSLDQARAALANMEQLVQVDVRSAHVDVEQFVAQVKAATATLLLREKTHALELEKFRLGRSTTLSVAQAQRDLLASQLALAEAVVGVRKAFLDLYRLEGSLLAHRGIE